MSNNKGRLLGFALLFTAITCFLLFTTIPLSHAQFTAPGVTGTAPYLGVPYQGAGFGYAPTYAPLGGFSPQYPGAIPYAPGFTNYSGSSAFTAPNAAYNPGLNQIGFPGTGYNPMIAQGFPTMAQPGFAPYGLNTAALGFMNPGLINPVAGAFGLPISPFQPFAQQVNPFMPFAQQVNPFMPFAQQQQFNPFMPYQQQQYNPWMPYQQQQYNPWMPYQQQQWNPWNPYSNTGGSSSNNNSSNNNTTTTDDIPDVTGWWSGTWKAYKNHPNPDPNTGPFSKDPNTGEVIIAATGELVIHVTQQNDVDDPSVPLEGTMQITGWSPGSPENPPEWSGDTSEIPISSGWISENTQYIYSRIVYTEGDKEYHFFWRLGGNQNQLNITDTHISGIFIIAEGLQNYLMQGTFTAGSFQP